MPASLDTTPLSEWKEFNKRPFLIAGPCSAETESQVMATAEELSKIPEVNVFRAGIWKPRTRPNSFEGVGKKGLKWLKAVKEQFGLSVATEVGNERHVYEALQYGIDILWIGTRTTVNPFTVQEIANALKGSDVAVLVKNPINPDVDLWRGAIERILDAGIKRVAAVHRGFSSYEKTTYRNQPNWQIPIDLRQYLPDIPLICDPCHISGDRQYLSEISQKALDLNFDGLMIETHPDPSNAWSDSLQQLTPNDLSDMLKSLVIRESRTNDANVLNVLDNLRDQIDVLDDAMIDLLERRMAVVNEIGDYKKEHNMTILQQPRWEEILKSSIQKGTHKGLSAEFIEAIFKAIHQESINKQTEIMNKK